MNAPAPVILRGVKARIIINDAAIDAAIDHWWGFTQWREHGDAEDVRRQMRKALEAAIAAAPLEIPDS
jgi:hypothetical protein